MKIHSALMLLSITAASPVFSQTPVWTGQAQCQLTVQTPGYAHQEVQTWTLTGGQPTTQGVMQVFPATWSVSGQGRAQQSVGGQLLPAQWTSNVSPMSGPIAVFVRAADNRLVIKSVHAQLHVPGATTGTRQVAAGGLVPVPMPFTSDVYEWPFPTVEDASTSTNVSGSGTVVVAGSYLPLQSASASATANCTWQFQSGLAPSSPSAGTVSPLPPTGSTVTQQTAAPLSQKPTTAPGLPPQITDVNPGFGQPGRTHLVVTLTGKNTHFVQGATVADFGPGIILTGPALVTSETSAIVVVSIIPGAIFAPHTVTLTTNSEVARSSSSGFQVYVPQSSDLTGTADGGQLSAWDQTFPAAARWVVLSNFNGDAVLDRNTGLVWQRRPTGEMVWGEALLLCPKLALGGQKGFRMPSISELSSLADPSRTPQIPVDAPFVVDFLSSTDLTVWSATFQYEHNFYLYLDFQNGEVRPERVTVTTLTEAPAIRHAWCVRGPATSSH